MIFIAKYIYKRRLQYGTPDASQYLPTDNIRIQPTSKFFIVDRATESLDCVQITIQVHTTERDVGTAAAAVTAAETVTCLSCNHYRRARENER